MEELGQPDQDYGMADKTFNLYIVGFFICVLLTLIPWATVKFSGYSFPKTLAHIYIAAFAQAVIQIVFFLRINWKTRQAQLNLMAFLYIVLLTTVVIGGTLWIMWNLNYRMM